MIGQVAQCTQCGAKTAARFSKCPGCGGQLVPLGTPMTPSSEVAPQTAPGEGMGRSRMERSSVLDGAIRSYTIQGYRIVDRTDTTAQLVKDQEFSFPFALLWMLFLGIGIIVYLIFYAAKQDTILWLEVDTQGQIHTTRNHRSQNAWYLPPNA